MATHTKLTLHSHFPAKAEEMNTNCTLVKLLALSCLSLLAGHVEAQRVISNAELQRLNPQLIERVTRNTAIGMTSSSVEIPRSTAIRDLTLGGGHMGTAIDNNIEGSEQDFTLQLDEYVVLKTKSDSRAIDCRNAGVENCIETPFQFLAMTSSGAPVDLSLVIETTQKLRYSENKGNFIGNLFVQLKDSASPGSVKDISTTIRIVVSGPLDEVSPNAVLDINKTNRFQKVGLAVREPEEPTIIRVTPERSVEPQQVEFSVTRPMLEVRIGQKSILGYGLETATVTVQASNLEDIPASAISITSETGKLNQNSIRFNEDGMASTLIRSRSIGKDVITAEMSPFSSGSDTVTYEPPWTWLVAVLFGAVMGIAIRITMRMRNPKMKGGWVFDVSIGLLGGLFTALLYALGVNILGLPLPSGYSESLTLVLSGLGGWVFPAWLTKFKSEIGQD